MTSNYLETYAPLRELSHPMARPDKCLIPRRTPDFASVPVEGRLSVMATFSPGDTAPHQP